MFTHVSKTNGGMTSMIAVLLYVQRPLVGKGCYGYSTFNYFVPYHSLLNVFLIIHCVLIICRAYICNKNTFLQYLILYLLYYIYCIKLKYPQYFITLKFNILNVILI